MTNFEITLIVLLIFAIMIIVQDYFTKEDLLAELKWRNKRSSDLLGDKVLVDQELNKSHQELNKSQCLVEALTIGRDELLVERNDALGRLQTIRIATNVVNDDTYQCRV